MARIRTIKPEFCSSKDTGALSRDARLFFLQLLTEADDEGRLLWIPRRLCGVLYPHDEEGPSAVTVSMLRAWAKECVDRGMLTAYSSDGVDYISVTNWAAHQKISHPAKSRLPAPSGNPPEEFLKSSGESPEFLRPDLGTGNREREQGKNPLSSVKPEDGQLELPKTETAPPAPPAPPADLAVRRAERLATVTGDAIAAYNRLLAKPKGKLAAVHATVGRKKRQQQVQRTTETASEICADQFGDKRITPEFWEAYFGACADDPFMSGEGPYAGQHANWRPDFEYLTRPATMLKVFDRATDHAEAS